MSQIRTKEFEPGSIPRESSPASTARGLDWDDNNDPQEQKQNNGKKQSMSTRTSSPSTNSKKQMKNKIIKLNIGGKYFTTTLQTIMREDWMIASMLSGRYPHETFSSTSFSLHAQIVIVSHTRECGPCARATPLFLRQRVLWTVHTAHVVCLCFARAPLRHLVPSSREKNTTVRVWTVHSRMCTCA